MTLNATAGHIETAPTVNTEKRDTLVFFGVVAALVGAIVITGATVGLGGVGMIGIAETAAMLVICLLLTAG